MWALVGVSVAALALLALAARTPGSRTSLASTSTSTSTAKLWGSGVSSQDSVSVSAADIVNLGLRAPAGFNVRAINVSANDVAR